MTSIHASKVRDIATAANNKRMAEERAVEKKTYADAMKETDFYKSIWALVIQAAEQGRDQVAFKRTKEEIVAFSKDNCFSEVKLYRPENALNRVAGEFEHLDFTFDIYLDCKDNDPKREEAGYLIAVRWSKHFR